MRKDNLQGHTNTDEPITEHTDDDAKPIGSIIANIMESISPCDPADALQPPVGKVWDGSSANCATPAIRWKVKNIGLRKKGSGIAARARKLTHNAKVSGGDCHEKQSEVDESENADCKELKGRSTCDPTQNNGEEITWIIFANCLTKRPKLKLQTGWFSSLLMDSAHSLISRTPLGSPMSASDVRLMNWTPPIIRRWWRSGSIGLSALLKLVKSFGGSADDAIGDVSTTLGDNLVKPSAAAEQFARYSRTLGVRVFDVLIDAGK